MIPKKGFHFFSAFLSVLVLCVSLCGTAYGADVEYIQKPTFWHWLNGQGSILNGIVAYGLGQACPNSDDGYHRSSSYEYESSLRGGYRCICDYCDTKFLAYETDLQQSYDAYVSDLPASGYSSSGELRWRLNVRSLEGVYGILSSGQSGSTFSAVFKTSSSSSYRYESVRGYFDEFLAPISGHYSLHLFFVSDDPVGFYNKNYYYISNPSLKISYFETNPVSGVLHSFSTFDFISGEKIVSSNNWFFFGSSDIGRLCSITGYWELSCVPVTIPSGDVYNIATRPTSITGGNYRIVGDNGQIVKVEDNSTIVNETNNTYFNPATGTTSPIIDWSYDYSTRTYTVTLENGTTQTITYGDENITIKEGDTVYNIYYLVDGFGTEILPCAHEWTETNRADPTCTRPGSVDSACSKCQQTKTESIPALGHDWKVKQTVTTEYDDTGQLTQEGYTIFECSRCHEQYKSPDGTIPPGGGSGTDPGDSEETLWDKLANWAASVFGGLIGMAEAVLGKILDALISLTDMLMERLKTVVETVLSIFEELPKLFGGFLDFLGAVFPFLPPELMTLLTFGVIAVVAIGIFKAVRR